MDLKAFYKTTMGRMVRRALQVRIRSIWSDVKGLRVMGSGYAEPYLHRFLPEAERVFVVSALAGAVPHWPSDADRLNRVCRAGEGQFPIENSSVDRALIVHGYDLAYDPDAYMREIYRVMKPEGRILMIVPSRSGWWMKADWSPFGHGRPFTERQICGVLVHYGFVCEVVDKALFFPPLKYKPLLRAARVFEVMGRFILPFMAGAHVIEARKEVFAGAGKGPGSKISARDPAFVPAAQGVTGRSGTH